MLLSIQKREKNKTFDSGSFTGPQKVEFAVPVGLINTSGIIRTTGCRIDHGVNPVEGVIKTCWIEQITSSELATPFLQKGCFPWSSHHAADIMTLIKGPAGDLPTQGSCSTDDKNLHGAFKVQRGA